MSLFMDPLYVDVLGAVVFSPLVDPFALLNDPSLSVGPFGFGEKREILPVRDETIGVSNGRWL